MDMSGLTLPTSFAPVTQQGWNGGSEQTVFPRFYLYMKPQYGNLGPDGAPVSKPVDMVEIHQAGEVDYVKEEVNELHKRRWPQHWAAYKDGKEQIATGTPLELLFPANPEVVSELKRFNIHTIQALILVPDSATAQGVRFLADWKKKAEIFLKGTEKGKGFHELERGLATANQENRELKEKLALQDERMAKLEAALTKKD